MYTIYYFVHFSDGPSSTRQILSLCIIHLHILLLTILTILIFLIFST